MMKDGRVWQVPIPLTGSWTVWLGCGLNIDLDIELKVDVSTILCDR